MWTPGQNDEVEQLAKDAGLGCLILVFDAGPVPTSLGAAVTITGHAMRDGRDTRVNTILGALDTEEGAELDSGLGLSACKVISSSWQPFHGSHGSTGDLGETAWRHLLTADGSSDRIGDRVERAVRGLSAACERSDWRWPSTLWRDTLQPHLADLHENHISLIVFMGSFTEEIDLHRQLHDDNLLLVPTWRGEPEGAGHRQPPLAAGWGKRRAEISDEDRVEHNLRRARALRELAEIESRRAIWFGYRAGLSQRKVGDLVGRSQPDVGRTIKKVEQDPDILDAAPREFALRRLVGEYTDQQMMDSLLAFEFSTGESEPSPLGSGYRPGAWDQVRALRRDRLITEGEWDGLFRAAFGQPAVQPQVHLPTSADQ